VLALLLVALYFASVNCHAGTNDYRIVSLNPTITENLFALGLGAQVVGTTAFSNFPPEAKKIPLIGDSRINLEKIVSLKPTHVLYFKEQRAEDLVHLHPATKVIELPFKKISDFTIMLTQLGFIFDKQKQAATLIHDWNRAWTFAKNIAKNKAGLLIQVEHYPIMVAGNDEFLSEVVQTCGLKNLMNHPGYPRISKEHVLKMRPPIVLALLEDSKTSAKNTTKKFWGALPNSKIIFFDPNIITRLSPRLPRETQKLCQQLEKAL